MWKRHAGAFVALIALLSAARAEEFHIEDSGASPNWDVAAIKPGAIVFSDGAPSASGIATMQTFADWSKNAPAQKKFLALFPTYSEPTITKASSSDMPAGQVLEKLDMYVAQARFILNRAPTAIDLPHYVALPVLGKID